MNKQMMDQSGDKKNETQTLHKTFKGSYLHF